MQLAHPEYLWLFLVYIPLIIWYIYKLKVSHPEILMSSIHPFKNIQKSYKEYLYHLLFVLRLFTIGLLIIIACRPQKIDKRNTAEGIDIVFAMDVSTSMLAKDFTPNRFEAAKKVASKFVTSRTSDNIGLVIFAAEGFTAVPMTTDVPMIASQINNIQIGMLEDGTAIGDGLSMAINRIKNGTAKSKIIILLTDGTNNTGLISPIKAAEMAKEKGIKIYSIGVGTNGEALSPIGVDMVGQLRYAPQPVVIDDKTLNTIAEMTDGKYYRATDNDVLQQVFNDIDKLEKSKIDVKNYAHAEDDYMLLAWLALTLILIEIITRFTVLRSIP